MDIQKFIASEMKCTSEDQQEEYTQELLLRYDLYCNQSLAELEYSIEIARAIYARSGATHANTARCVVIHELIQEKKGKPNV